MARTMSNLEYLLALRDAHDLVGRRLDKVFELEPGVFRFDYSKYSLIIRLGEAFYITEHPPKSPQEPSNFAMQARKIIQDQGMITFAPYASDRIYMMEFYNGNKAIIEQFAQGNMFLCDKEGNILRPYHFKLTEKKKYLVGQKYEFPKAAHFPFPPGEEQMEELVRKAGDLPVAKALAKWPVGRAYTDEATLRCRIPAETKLGELDMKQKKAIVSEIAQILQNRKFVAYARKADGEPSEFAFSTLDAYESKPEEFERKEFETFSQAVEFYYSNLKKNAEVEEPEEVRKLKKRLEEQKSAIAAIEADIAKWQKRAEYVEKNMAFVDEIIEKEKGVRKKIYIEIG